MIFIYICIGLIIGFSTCWVFIVRRERLNAERYPVFVSRVNSDNDIIGHYNANMDPFVRIDEMILGDENSHHIKLQPIKSSRKLTTEAINMPTNALVGITSIVQHAPKAIVAGVNFANAGKIVLQFSPEMMAKLHEGSSELVKAIGGGYRAIARNVGTLQFEEHARIVNVTNVAMVSVGVWQILAIVTASLSKIDF